MSISFASGSSSLLCFGVFVVFFAAIILFVIVMKTRQHKAVSEFSEQAGFSKEPQPYAQLLAQLQPAYLPQTLQRVSNVWRKTSGDQTIYIYDAAVNDPNSNETQLTSANLAVVSPYLNLPRFVINPRTPIPEFIGSRVEQLMAMGMGNLGLENYQDVPPDFDSVYSLYVETSPLTAPLFTSERLSALAQLPGFTLRGSGRVLLVSRTATIGKMDAANMSDQVNRAHQIAAILGE